MWAWAWSLHPTASATSCCLERESKCLSTLILPPMVAEGIPFGDTYNRTHYTHAWHSKDIVACLHLWRALFSSRAHNTRLDDRKLDVIFSQQRTWCVLEKKAEWPSTSLSCVASLLLCCFHCSCQCTLVWRGTYTYMRSNICACIRAVVVTVSVTSCIFLAKPSSLRAPAAFCLRCYCTCKRMSMPVQRAVCWSCEG
jgi:hypothetical protein